MDFKYDYNIADFLNQKVDLDSLTISIYDSSVDSSLSYIQKIDPSVNLFFSSELLINDISILNYIVQNHTGEPLSDEFIYNEPVKIEAPLFITDTSLNTELQNVTIAVIDASGKMSSSGIMPSYYGQYYLRYESSPNSTTYSTSPVSKIDEWTPPLPPGMYKISVSWLWSRSSTNANSYFSFSLDNVAQGERNTLSFRISNITEVRSQYRVFYVSFDTHTAHRVALNFWNSSGNTTISDALIEIIRVL
jgi:hypothetical protein